MNTAHKREFISELMVSHAKLLLDHIDHVPARWDGRELRKWYAETAKGFDMGISPKQRYKDYRNDIQTLNLT